MSGGGSSPSSQTVTQTNIPEYARPYAESMLGQGQALTDTTVNPYQAYEGQRFAGFSPMQAQAFQSVANQQVAPQLADASNLAYAGAQQGLGAQQNAMGLQQNALQYGGLGAEYGALGAMTAPQAQQYGAQGVGIGGIGVQQAQQGFGAGAQYAQQATSPESMQAYMSPYMQNVVDQQQREAVRQSQIQQQGMQSQAAQQGAFGGSRSAILEAERQRNLGTQLGDIQGAGLQRAYEQAQQAQQFGSELGLKGLQTGYGGLDVGLRGTEAGLRGIQTGLQGTAQGIQGAQAGLEGVGRATAAGQYGLSGAELGIRGADVLGGLGARQFEQQMAISDAQQKYGALQQGQQQQGLDFAYQQEMARQQYPYQQLSYMSDLLRGVPSSGQTKTMYGGQPNQSAQLLGAGLSAYGAIGRKEGGQIKKYQEGGSVSPDAMSTMAVQELPSQLKRLSDTQLAAYARNVKDAITLSAVQSEMQRRARTRMPGGEAPQQTTAQEVIQRAEAAGVGQPRVQMAGGGIVALQGGGQPFVENSAEFGELINTPGQPTIIDRALTNVTDVISQSIDAGPYALAERQRLAEAEQLANAQANARANQDAANIGNAMNEARDFNRATPEQWAAGRNDPIPDSGVKPQVPEGSPDWWASTVPQEQVPDTYIEQPPQQPQTGIAGAGAARRGMLGGTFEQFRSMIPKGEMDPQQQNLLNDMQSRLTKKLDRAESQENAAKFDAILMAGLAMMGGTSLADGIARAAQTGGATYMSSKKDAAKALNAAEDAELAFRQYEMSVMKGNDDAARKDWGSYMDHIAKLQDIDSRYAVAGINAQTRAAVAAEQRAFTAAENEKDRAAQMERTNITAGAAADRAALNAPRLALQDEIRINNLVKDKFEDRLDAVAMMPAGPEKNTAAAQLEQDMEAYRRQRQASLGGGNPQGAVAPPSAGIGNRPDIASTMKPFN